MPPVVQPPPAARPPAAAPPARIPAPPPAPRAPDRTLRRPPAERGKGKPDHEDLASWGSRAVAQLIDWAIILVPGGLLALMAVGFALGDDGETDTALETGGIILLGFVVLVLAGALYGPLLMRREGRRNGQTWGKQALGITVTRDSGEPFGFGSAAYREVGLKGLAVTIACFIIPVIPFFADYLWPLWDSENRAIHDMAADTHVVKLRA